MQVSQIITDVRNELVEANASYWSDTELLTLASRAERDFVQKTRCLEGKATLTLVAGQQDYTLPSNWLSAMAVFVNVPNGSTPVWQRIEATNLEKESQINQDHPSSDSTLRGTPMRYWIWNKSIYFDPIPDAVAATQVLMFFKAKPITFVSTSDSINVDDSLSEAINNFMLWKAWKKEQESDKAAEYQALYEENVRQGHRYMKKQSGDQRFRLDIESNRNFGSGAAGFNPFGTTN